MQAKMKAAQDSIKNIEAVGESGGNLVKVILTGDYEIKSITVSEEAKKEQVAWCEIHRWQRRVWTSSWVD
mgnify:CR=1 FL=1